MGPCVLFDKSFLQSLSLDEAVLFDNFFLCNIAPLFFVETLADLEKAVREGRTPEDEVGIIASKTPELHAEPNATHGNLCLGELLGHRVPMTGQIILSGGYAVKAGDKTGFVHEPSREVEAMSRWRNREFLEVERQFARTWRSAISEMDFEGTLQMLNAVGIRPQSCKTLEQAKGLAEAVFAGTDRHFERMKLAIELLHIPERYRGAVFERWKNSGYRPLVTFAPYAAHVCTVELFFYIATAAELLSAQRVTNKIDLAYIYYVPFCTIFVSSDNIHRRCVPLFMRDDQQFIWGLDLKASLKSVDEAFSKLPQAELEKGLFHVASRPPNEATLIVELFDRFCPGWRKSSIELPLSPELNSSLAEQVSKMAEARRLSPAEIDFDVSDTDAVTMKMRLHKKRGKYWQLPKDLKRADE